MGAQEQGSPGLELTMAMALSKIRDKPRSKLFTIVRDPLEIKAGLARIRAYQYYGLPGLVLARTRADQL